MDGKGGEEHLEQAATYPHGSTRERLLGRISVIKHVQGRTFHWLSRTS